MLQFVGLEGLKDDEPLPAHVAGVRPFPRVDPLMVLVRSFVEKRPATRLAVVLHLTGVNELVSFQRTCGVEALAARLAAEWCHIHCRPVRTVDNSAVTPLLGSSSDDPTASFLVSYSLVFLQMAIVKKSLATQVTHERL